MKPLPLTVTVDRKYNSSVLIETGVKIYYVKREWYSLGACTMESPSGFPITVYDPERTICDIIRRRSTMDISAFNYALREYMRRKDRNLGRLSDYVKVMHMEKQFWDTMGGTAMIESKPWKDTEKPVTYSHEEAAQIRNLD